MELSTVMTFHFLHMVQKRVSLGYPFPREKGQGTLNYGFLCVLPLALRLKSFALLMWCLLAMPLISWHFLFAMHGASLRGKITLGPSDPFPRHLRFCKVSTRLGCQLATLVVVRNLFSISGCQVTNTGWTNRDFSHQFQIVEFSKTAPFKNSQLWLEFPKIIDRHTVCLKQCTVQEGAIIFSPKSVSMRVFLTKLQCRCFNILQADIYVQRPIRKPMKHPFQMSNIYQVNY